MTMLLRLFVTALFLFVGVASASASASASAEGPLCPAGCYCDERKLDERFLPASNAVGDRGGQADKQQLGLRMLDLTQAVLSVS